MTTGLWLAHGKRRGDDPLHWILILADEGGDTGTYYHVTGGPTQGTPYELQIQSGKRFNSHGIAQHYFIGDFDKKDKNKLKASAQKFQPQRCQEWTTQVLGDLEKKNLVPQGTYNYWYGQIENSPYSTDGVHGIHQVSSSSTNEEEQLEWI